jgi:beta-1,4-mannosyl-glycoprotein beta-1,4-N-acetylglucosaminyltransferase
MVEALIYTIIKKFMKIFDCFTFFNELDLLEFRLRLLSGVVDKFVICESNLTFSGNEKPYYFDNNRSRFKDWEDKILYLPIEQNKDGLKFENVNTYSPNNGPFLLEYQQRNALLYAAELMEEDDFILLGDLDEIPNPEAINALIQSNILLKDNMNAVSLCMLFHYYYMNVQVEGHDRDWLGTVSCKSDFFKKNGPQYIRDNRKYFSMLPNSGWHFSYLGGIEKIKSKIQSFAHTEFNRPDITSEENISNSISKGMDIFHRQGVSYKTASIEAYPEFLRSLMLEYPQFIKNEVTINNK